MLAPRREIAGVVECDGAIEIHPEGFRAERGRPRALVATPMRNPALVTRLATAYAAEVATVDGPDGLVDWCRERDLGLEPTVVDDLLGPGDGERLPRGGAPAHATARRRLRGLDHRRDPARAPGVLRAAGPQGPHVVRGRSGEVTIP